MRAAISYGLLAAMVVAVAFLGWQSRQSLGAVFRDDVLRCNCGSTNISYVAIPKPFGGSEASYYIATCKDCGLRRQVVDVDWCSPGRALDAWLDSTEGR